MATDQIEERPGFSDLLAELSDSDIVLEVAAGAGSRRPPELGRVRELDEVFGSEAQRQFLLKLDDLAHDIVSTVEHYRQNTAPPRA